MVARHRAGVAFALAFLLAACASAPNASPQEKAVEALRAANASYEETMKAVGRARGQGRIDEATYEALITKGERVEMGLRGAYGAVGAWLVVGTEGGYPAALAELTAALADLAVAWGEHHGN